MTVRFSFLVLLAAVLGIPVRSQDIGDLIREGKISEARSVLARLEKENLTQESVPFLRGILSVQADSAERYYEAYLEKNPDGRFSDEAQFRIAQLKYAQGLYHSAGKKFDRIVFQHPLTPFKAKCLYWSGMCYLAMNQRDSAGALFQRLNRQFPMSEYIGAIPQELLAADTVAQAPENPPRESAETVYSIQIGAFSNQNNALLRKAFFEREGYPVLLKSKRRNGDLFFLVWLGSFPNWEEAKAFGEKVKAKYGTSYTLVSE